MQKEDVLELAVKKWIERANDNLHDRKARGFIPLFVDVDFKDYQSKLPELAKQTDKDFIDAFIVEFERYCRRIIQDHHLEKSYNALVDAFPSLTVILGILDFGFEIINDYFATHGLPKDGETAKIFSDYQVALRIIEDQRNKVFTRANVFHRKKHGGPPASLEDIEEYLGMSYAPNYDVNEAYKVLKLFGLSSKISLDAFRSILSERGKQLGREMTNVDVQEVLIMLLEKHKKVFRMGNIWNPETILATLKEKIDGFSYEIEKIEPYKESHDIVFYESKMTINGQAITKRWVNNINVCLDDVINPLLEKLNICVVEFLIDLGLPEKYFAIVPKDKLKEFIDNAYVHAFTTK